MGYIGYSIPIPVGVGGLLTDDDPNAIPPTNLILANNVDIRLNQVAKYGGSFKYNSSSLSSEVVGVFDWFPTASQQRLIAVTADGKVYRDTGDGLFNGNAPIFTAFGTLTPTMMMVEGGLESGGRNKKLFFFTGTRQVKVLSGDGMTLTSIANPAADWATRFPKFGLIHRGYHFAFGNDNSPHTVYRSLATDHENFSDSAAGIYQVSPGEFDGLVAGGIYKGRMFVFKQPYGVYGLIDTDTDPDNWYFQKITDSFGISSPHGLQAVLDDFLAGSVSGSVTSIIASQKLGGIESGDIMKLLQVEDFIQKNTVLTGVTTQHSVYYKHRKQVFFTFRSGVQQYNDRVFVIDFNKEQPRCLFSDKDQVSCLDLRKDQRGIQRPMYGSADGFVYLMDKEDRDVAGAAYTGEFQIPHTDFSWADNKLNDKNKIFDFLEVFCEPTGTWNLSVDVYVDGIFIETLNFVQGIGNSFYDVAIFDTDRFSTEAPQSQRQPLHGQGKRISLRCYNSEVDHTFKVSKLVIGFRVSDERQENA